MPERLKKLCERSILPGSEEALSYEKEGMELARRVNELNQAVLKHEVTYSAYPGYKELLSEHRLEVMRSRSRACEWEKKLKSDKDTAWSSVIWVSEFYVMFESRETWHKDTVKRLREFENEVTKELDKLAELLDSIHDHESAEKAEAGIIRSWEAVESYLKLYVEYSEDDPDGAYMVSVSTDGAERNPDDNYRKARERLEKENYYGHEALKELLERYDPAQASDL